MYKNQKRILAVCLIIALLFSITISASATDTAAMEEVKLQNTGNTISYNTAIMHSFQASDGSQYPDWYGGSYADEYGNLVIAVKGNLFDARGKALEAAKNSDAYKSDARTLNTISFSKVKYSYRELHSMLYEISDFLELVKADDAYAQFRKKVSSLGINDNYNTVSVYFKEYDAELEEKLKEIASYPDALRFIKPKPTVASAKTSDDKDIVESQRGYSVMKPGMRITIDENGGGGYSIGFRCFRTVGNTTQYGFVSSAHVDDFNMVDVGDVVMQGNYGSTIGVVRSSVLGGNVDACFFELTNSITGSNVTAYENITIEPYTYVTESYVGMPVYKEGYKTGFQEGVITATSGINHDAAVRVVNCLKADYTSQQGDSGGIVYTYFNGDWVIVGLHEGLSEVYYEDETENDVRSLICQAKYIIPALGVTPY